MGRLPLECNVNIRGDGSLVWQAFVSAIRQLQAERPADGEAARSSSKEGTLFPRAAHCHSIRQIYNIIHTIIFRARECIYLPERFIFSS
jgi:hypothetical protein